MLKPAEIVLVVATAHNNVIGKDNQLPWHLPEDLAHFRKVTTGHCIIMGRKTFESIGKALPNRRSIVISHSPQPAPALAGAGPESIEWASSLEQALTMSQQDLAPAKWPSTPVFVIGGAQLYKQSIHLARRIEQTEIDIDIDGDAWFPDIDAAQWQLAGEPAASGDQGATTQVSKTGLSYRFLSWHRKNA